MVYPRSRRHGADIDPLLSRNLHKDTEIPFDMETPGSPHPPAVPHSLQMEGRAQVTEQAWDRAKTKTRLHFQSAFMCVMQWGGRFVLPIFRCEN
jgi:hypothetical protein